MTDKATLVPDIWRIFYDRLKNNVNSITTQAGMIVTIKQYDAAFADRPFDDNTYYPVMVINTPSVPAGRFTNGLSRVDGSILLEVYTFQAESADRFIAAMQDSIETYQGILADNGLRQLKYGDLQSDMVIRGTIKCHIRRLPINFKFYYLKTLSY